MTGRHLRFVSVAGETRKSIYEEEPLAVKVTSAVTGVAATVMPMMEVWGKEQRCPPWVWFSKCPANPEGSLYPFLLKPDKAGFRCLQLKILPYTIHPGLFKQWNEMKHAFLGFLVHSFSFWLPYLRPDLYTRMLTHNRMHQWTPFSSVFWLSSANRKPQHEMWWRKEG